MDPGVLRDLLLIFLVAIPTVILANRVRTPALVGFILTGVVIGPTALGLIRDVHRIEQIAELGVAFLLFSIGLELKFSHLASVKKIALGGGILQILLTGFMAPLLAWGMGWSRVEQIYFGCMIALSSTALVMSVLSGQRRVDSLAGRVSAGVLILQDLSLAPILIFLPLVSSPQIFSSWLESLAQPFLRVVLLFSILFVVGRYLLIPLLDQVAKTRSRELFLCFVIAFALGVALLTKQWGLSFSFGAFLAGLILSQTEYRFQALSEISSFRYVFASIFFVSVGMLVDLRVLYEHLPWVVGIAFAVWILKMLITAGSLRVFGLPWSVSSEVGMALGQVGEFSFLILLLGKNNGVLQPDFYQLCLAVVSFTLILTPFGVRFSPALARFLARKISPFPLPQRESPSLKDHVIICGFGPLGQALGKMLSRHRISYLVLELNPVTVKRLKKDIPIIFGDGSSAEILYSSGIESARALAVAAPDFLNAVAIIEQAKRMNPNLPILTRARYRTEVDELYRAGADVVVSEELEAGVEMGRYLLLQLGIPSSEVDLFVREIRDFGSADFF